MDRTDIVPALIAWTLAGPTAVVLIAAVSKAFGILQHLHNRTKETQ